ncbi:putative 2-aminoethylphosphonate ABC transporter ATP-binding protein [Carnobacterium gallinarum]|uniref:putative 2-aminoethylphosphonate ABC transporter ATP-binding protein n=1 Tax=Carnobacterium gallinarum TaxID=2749 RepID=UPI000551FBAF|nr:putative 2-aminoethylphosphonate ABC transporter ATP-binding protein [Carnobacterium gallinarum]
MQAPYLEVQQVNKQFGKFDALKEISLTIEKGEFVCLLGPSGCGKTTLLRIIAGLETASTGEIIIAGKNVTRLVPAKRNFGIVFQSYALFPNMTVEQNIEYGLKNKKIDSAQRKQQVAEVIEFVDLNHVKKKYPAQLSGGQQQRVALARAISLKPDLLLLDEPLSALDAKVRERLRVEIKEIQKKLGITAIMVTHDQEEALTMADKVVVMNHAQIMQIGTPEEIYKTPTNPFVAKFIGSMNFWETQQVEEVYGIRPEHVTLSNEGEGEKGEVTAIEFRGSHYRIQVKMKESLYFSTTNEVIVDIQAKELEKAQLSIGSELTLTFNPKKILTYPKRAVEV